MDGARDLRAALTAGPRVDAATMASLRGGGASADAEKGAQIGSKSRRIARVAGANGIIESVKNLIAIHDHCVFPADDAVSMSRMA